VAPPRARTLPDGGGPGQEAMIRGSQPTGKFKELAM
jgi:hypothetical protein